MGTRPSTPLVLRVPFSLGARKSELTTYSRERGKRPLDLTLEEVATVYQQVTGEEFPLSAAQLKRAFDPAEIIRNRKGPGGPQPDEIDRMIGEQRRDSATIQEWVEHERRRLGRTILL